MESLYDIREWAEVDEIKRVTDEIEVIREDEKRATGVPRSQLTQGELTEARVIEAIKRSTRVAFHLSDQIERLIQFEEDRRTAAAVTKGPPEHLGP